MTDKSLETGPAIVAVAVATPHHAGVPAILSYTCEHTLLPGALVRVPLGRREVLGIVWEAEQGRAVEAASSGIKPVAAWLSTLGGLSAAWRQLLQFSARYYQRSVGELALASLPPQLRELDAAQLAQRVRRASEAASRRPQRMAVAPQEMTLSAEQQSALDGFFAGKPQPTLLWGSTGSGKTEVYLRCVQAVLRADEQAQALVMVPEINLTPQLQTRFGERFGQELIVTLHSSMTPAQRLQAWLLAHTGRARIVLGTRMSIFASLPHLRLIVVDEEHDASYKAQDGARHSARDLAVMRAKLEMQHSGHECRVLLGSATPSLETWHACESGRYRRLAMPSRMGGAALPQLIAADMRQEPRGSVFSSALVAALKQRVASGEQSLVFLNRRGYAPVLACGACDWKSECPHCSAYRVFHKSDRSLRCHHCGHAQRVPRACPECGNLDIAPLGRGTQKIEEQLAAELAGVTRPDGRAAVVLRIDADSTRLKGQLQAQLAQVHAGEVDVLVGTQMITKGHDFRRISLVAAIDADAALFSSDFRAPERLFALLMQAAGRAGRDAGRLGSPAQMWVQTRYPDHPLFSRLAAHDYAGFAAQQLREREQAMLAPFSFQALLRAEGRSQEAAQAFLQAAHDMAKQPDGSPITVYPPVPMSIARVADVERAQMLLESTSRAALSQFLEQWLPVLRSLRSQPACKGLIRFAVDVDPLVI